MNFQELKNKLSQHGMAKHFSYNLSANLINQVRWFFLVWVATQLLSVNDYGIFALIVMLIMTAIDLSDMGINASTTRFVSQYHKQEQGEKLYATIFLSLKRKGFNAIVVAILIFIFAGQISQLLFQRASSYYLVQISTPGIMFGLLNGLNIAILQGQRRFGDILRIALLCTVFTLLLLTGMYAYGWLTLEGFIWLHIFSLGVSFLVSLRCIFRDLRISCQYRHMTGLVKKEFRDFGLWMFLWAIFVVLQSRIDVVMLAQLTSAVEVAYYDLAMKYTRPLMMVFSSYGQVLNPLVAGARTKSELKQLISGCNGFLKKMTLLLVVGVAIAEPLVVYIIGDAYEPAVMPLRIILVALIFFIWTMPYNTVMFAMKKPFVFTVETILGATVTVVGNYIFLPGNGAMAAAGVFCVTQIVVFIAAILYARHYLAQEGEQL